MQAVQYQQLLPKGALRGNCSDALYVERPVCQFVGDVRRDRAGQARVERRSRSRLDPYARGHVGDIGRWIQGWVLDEDRLPVDVTLIRADPALIPYLIHQLGQRGAHVSENVVAAGFRQLLEESAPLPA